jgi:glucokinase
MKVIGIDLGGTNIDAGIVSEKKLVRVIHKRINAKRSQDEILSQIIQVTDQIFDKQIQGIGIGVPAIVDVKNGIVFEAANIPSWKEVHLKQILERKYNVPVHVNNDANCFVLGEKYFGIGKHYQNIVGIVLGTGIGAGIIINGKLYCGHNTGAGEFGRIIFRDGELEDYCSGKYFRKFGFLGEELFQKAEKNNAIALKMFENFGYNLGKALAIVVHSLDPEIIILGGSVSKAYKFFNKALMKSLKDSVYARTYSRIKIEVSDINTITILGAASLCYDY